MLSAGAALIGILIGAVGASIVLVTWSRSRVNMARADRERLLADAEREAEAVRREAQVDARERDQVTRTIDAPTAPTRIPMSAAPAESMEPPLEGVDCPRARRECSHPAVDLHGRRRTLPGRLRQVVVHPPSSVGQRPTEVVRRREIRSQGFRKRVRAGKTSDESSIILTGRPRPAQRQHVRRPARSPSRRGSVRSSGLIRGDRGCARRARARARPPTAPARRARGRRRRAGDRAG